MTDLPYACESASTSTRPACGAWPGDAGATCRRAPRAPRQEGRHDRRRCQRAAADPHGRRLRLRPAPVPGHLGDARDPGRVLPGRPGRHPGCRSGDPGTGGRVPCGMDRRGRGRPANGRRGQDRPCRRRRRRGQRPRRRAGSPPTRTADPDPLRISQRPVRGCRERAADPVRTSRGARRGAPPP